MNKDCIESAYCFFHQKFRVYKYSNLEWQKDDIEYAISEYVDAMDRDLYNFLSNNKKSYLQDHINFYNDIELAIKNLNKLINRK